VTALSTVGVFAPNRETFKSFLFLTSLPMTVVIVPILKVGEISLCRLSYSLLKVKCRLPWLYFSFSETMV